MEFDHHHQVIHAQLMDGIAPSRHTLQRVAACGVELLLAELP